MTLPQYPPNDSDAAPLIVPWLPPPGGAPNQDHIVEANGGAAAAADLTQPTHGPTRSPVHDSLVNGASRREDPPCDEATRDDPGGRLDEAAAATGTGSSDQTWTSVPAAVPSAVPPADGLVAAGPGESGRATLAGPASPPPSPARQPPGGPLGALDATAASTSGEAAALTHEQLVRAAAVPPTVGWRGAVLRATGGKVNLGLSREEALERQQLERIQTHLAHPHSVLVISLKGGVGKTTVAALLGLTFAQHRGDQVVVLDANPDAGTLADRLLGRSPAVSVRDLAAAAAAGAVGNPTDLARFATLTGRLHVLASEHDPAKSEAFDQQEYERVIAVLQRFFHVLITDSGTGVTHSATAGALAAARSIVVVGGPTVDGASRASKTLDWLRSNGHGDLADRAVVALAGDRTSPEVDPEAVRRYLAARSRTVVTIPPDPHLATGGPINLSRLRPATYDSARELAAAVADDFAPHELRDLG